MTTRDLDIANIHAAAGRLAESEAGRAALYHLHAWFRDGYVLDSDNQERFLGLIAAAWGPYAGTTVEAIATALER